MNFDLTGRAEERGLPWLQIAPRNSQQTDFYYKLTHKSLRGFSLVKSLEEEEPAPFTPACLPELERGPALPFAAVVLPGTAQGGCHLGVPMQLWNCSAHWQLTTPYQRGSGLHGPVINEKLQENSSNAALTLCPGLVDKFFPRQH
ncbi:hypothetical protein Y1Q_0022839 [Alligator mississippiensis]|uniref:Uncharacterized protein n=1 Tax=Alligator mississippiensis TaxID=8496 RepID=A0A151N4L2_ALLMI|nr:hypothetical protein Y1Q_0022839 [Alligator mississippiensis]